MKNVINITVLSALLITGGGCKKIIEVGTPENQLTTGAVFSDSNTALAALLNTYALFNNTIDGSYSPYVATYADELTDGSSNPPQLEFYKSSVSSTNGLNATIWQNFYFIIYSCNNLINQLSASSRIPAATATQLAGEARFLRAYAYFYLLNLYGNIPLVLATDVNATSVSATSSPSAVYDQITKDLTDAQNTLPVTYTGDGRVRANQYAATALLARVYLYQRDWPEAAAAASKVINSGLYTPLDDPADVFVAGSNECILEFWTQNGFISTGPVLIPDNSKPNFPLSENLVSAFEPGDLRLTDWVNTIVVSGVTYYYPYKFHNRSNNTSSPEYLMALRAGEQFLIRAEARVMQNDIPGAQADLNVIRSRAGLPNTTAGSAASLIDAIAHERQVELFTEWGHRFFDLKRVGQGNAVLGADKVTWKQNTSLLLPIPQTEITYDPNLKQNPGY